MRLKDQLDQALLRKHDKFIYRDILYPRQCTTSLGEQVTKIVAAYVLGNALKPLQGLERVERNQQM